MNDQHAGTDEDARIIKMCLDGDRDAFGQLVRKYQDRVYNVVYRLVDHPDDARELAQEVFLKCYRSLHRFQGASSFYTWLYRIAINAAISMQRSKRKLRCVDPDAQVEPVDKRFYSDPAHGLYSEDLRDQVGDALAQLAPEHRVVLVLKEVEGLKYDSIARILDCPIGTVRSRLHRARIELKSKLKHLVEQ